MSSTPNLADDTREQLAALINYLRDLHALRYPPIRSISIHGALRLDPRSCNELPGVELRPSDSTWLTASLLTPPSEPELPADLIEAAVPRLTAGDRPVARAGAENDARIQLEQWTTSVWDPWKREADRVELSRRLFLDLFETRDQVEVDGAALEVVWGFGRVRWREHELDHPLFTVGLEIEYVAEQARLDVRPTRSLRAETEILTGLPLVAQRQLFEAMAVIEEGGRDPWEHEFKPDLLAPLLQMMSHTPAAEGGPTLQLGEWVIFTRPKPSGYLSFVRGLEGHLGALAALPTLASLVATDPRGIDLGDSDSWLLGGQDVTTQDVLLPLPTNDEQREIVWHAKRAAGVTVEGPPGSGKSHTIANLICAFIAEGKRVLVTAERTHALEVLVDKIPEALQPLCVPVVGTGQAERVRLEHAIDRITQSAFGIDTHRSDAQRLPELLDETARCIALVLNDLREIREVEALPVPDLVSSEAWSSRADAAAWLLQNEANYSFITDPLEPNWALPWSTKEQQYLIDRLASISPVDLRRARDVRADFVLPVGHELASERRNRDTYMEIVDASPELATVTEVDAEDELAALGEQIALAGHEVADWESSDLRTAFEQLQAGPQQQLWRIFTYELVTAMNEVYSLHAELQTHQVTIPGEDPFSPDEMQALTDAETGLEQDGRLGFFQARARRLLKSCLVDGRVPSTATDVRLVRFESDLRSQRRVLRNLINSQRIALGLGDSDLSIPEDEGQSVASELHRMVGWLDKDWLAVRQGLSEFGIASPSVVSATDLSELGRTVSARIAASRVAGLDAARSELLERVREREALSTAAEVWHSLGEALRIHDWYAWDVGLSEVDRLSKLQDAAIRIDRLLESLALYAPNWANELRSTGVLPAETVDEITLAWAWRKVETWYRSSEPKVDTDALEDELRRLERVQQTYIGQLAAARAWLAVIDRIDGPTQVALAAYKTVSARIGKGYSKFKGTYQLQLAEALEGCRHVIPAWVMPVERVLTDFACMPEPLFDVLIIDEASQLPMTRLPIFSLARKVIVVGDDKQISPSSPGLEILPALQAMKSRLDSIPNAGATYFVGASVYDVAAQRFPRKVQLREHFRCLTPIIEFSNHRYYDGRLVPLRDRMPTPNWKPLNSVFVRDGFRDEDDCNRPEAERITELISELIHDPDYASRTFGVITLLGKNQMRLVYDLLVARIGTEKWTAHSIRVGDAATFQGDERDVILLSMVVADSDGRRIGAMTAKQHQQMVNVAASRARDQLWVVHSVPAEAFPAGDERAALIRHCSATTSAEVAYAALARQTDQQSPFERDLLRYLTGRGYRTIRPQYRVGRYRIDFVIDGPSSRLAIECDGDRFHGPDQWDADRARQAVLERAGWTFVRIPSSSFYRDPARALEPLWAKLEALGIPPFDWTVQDPPGIDATAKHRRGSSVTQESPRGESIGETESRSEITNDHDIDSGITEIEDSRLVESGKGSREALAEDDPWAAAFRAAGERIENERIRRQD